MLFVRPFFKHLLADPGFKLGVAGTLTSLLFLLYPEPLLFAVKVTVGILFAIACSLLVYAGIDAWQCGTLAAFEAEVERVRLQLATNESDH